MPRYNTLLKTNAAFKALRVNQLALTKAYATVHVSGRVAPRTTLIQIPVVVHILYSTDDQNISEDQVRSQLAVLNSDYQNKSTPLSAIPSPFHKVVGNPLLNFQLAVQDPSGKPTTGITRTKTTTTTFFSDGPNADNAKFASKGGENAWPSDQYLNIWICADLRDRTNRPLLGYSSFPGNPKETDGVVIVHTAFGTVGTATAPFNLGRTATHEIGHWLNLFHIWGDDENDADVCAGSDQVADTPNQATPNFKCPPYPHPSCGNDKDGGDMFMNYMDYTDDGCMQMFTAGQVLRIEATLSGLRAPISQSPALATPNSPGAH